MNLTREHDDLAGGDYRLSALSRAEDEAVMTGIVARIRAAEPSPSFGSGLGSPTLSVTQEPGSPASIDPEPSQ
jgi:hypothetical protein